MRDRIRIGTREIGAGLAPFIVAEVSGNHNGSLERALGLIGRARESGADAVKLQTYRPESLAVPIDDADFVITEGIWAGRHVHDIYEEAHTPYEWMPALFDKGKELGIPIFSSPFDDEAVELLEELGCPAYKIASLEMTDWPLLDRVARTRKPMLVSTGTHSLEEIEKTVDFLRSRDVEQLVILHCISAYPAPIDSANLRTMLELRDRLGIPVGLSDHTLGTTASVSATALGAVVIEKHITHRRVDGGPDSAFSLEPEEFKRLCEECRHAHSALGEVRFGWRKAELSGPVYSKRFYTKAKIKAGDPLTRANVQTIRAKRGIPAQEFEAVFNATAMADIDQYTPLDWNDLARGD